ncbi:CYP714C3 [Symbiodinium sp. CCMP2456]|nr:CYP714C3 [Symbiodinium sp. CCMP2456]
MDKTSPLPIVALCAGASIGIWLWWRKQKAASSTDIPVAEGGLPLLGHALQYQEDPTACIRRQELLVGKVFSLNLAGRRMVVIGSDSEAMKQVTMQPPTVLSAQRAVAEIGFEYLLGSTNVYKGTTFHKRVLKEEIAPKAKLEAMLPTLFQALSAGLDEESRLMRATSEAFLSHPDAFVLVRRCILRASLDVLVSPDLLRRDPSLLTALMSFQDRVEDATAKSAVLPRFLSLPLCLWPMALSRKRLSRRLRRLMEGSTEGTERGPWLRAFHSEQTSPEDAADFVIGLVFAAHKNPAIGAAQSLCFLRSLDEATQRTALAEAKKLKAAMTPGREPSKGAEEELLSATTLRRCVLETMRLTAHTLGALRYARESIEIQTKSSRLTIPQGATIAIAHNSTHTDTSVWGADASEFRLERPEWVRNGDLASPVDAYKLTTFSQGVHKCPGEKFSLAVMEMMLCILLVRDSQLLQVPKLSFERATLAQRQGRVPVTLRSEVKT